VPNIGVPITQGWLSPNIRSDQTPTASRNTVTQQPSESGTTDLVYFDRNYQQRHERRTGRKARLLARHIEPGCSLVDIGCNTGAISNYLLTAGRASKGTGLELNASIVLPQLRSNAKFCLIQDAIQNCPLKETYDVALYLAVSHHVFANFGPHAATSALRHIVEHCRHALFFEVGKISEGSAWPWQQAIRRIFRTDEAHLCFLFEAIEHAIGKIELIGFNPIHGTRREIWKISLKPFSERKEPSEKYRVVPLGLECDASLLKVRTNLRTSLTESAIFVTAEGQGYLLKQHINRPFATYREYAISRAVGKSWVVPSLGYTSDAKYIAFPFYENALDLEQCSKLRYDLRRALARRILMIFRELRDTRVDYPRPLEPQFIDSGTIFEICDLNPSNFIFRETPEGGVDALLVDLAFQAPGYGWKNERNLAQILLALGQFRVRAAVHLALAIGRSLLKLARVQFISKKQRVQRRFPSLLSFLHQEFSNFAGIHVEHALKALRRGRANK
jgi:SAM-dependent methyltransferase